RAAVRRRASSAAAGLPAGLDRLRGVPGGDGLQAGGARLELATIAVVVVALVADLAEDPVELGHDLLLGEVQRVRRGERREEATLVDAKVQHRNLVAIGRAELAPPSAVPDRDRQGGLGGAD